MTIEFTDFIRPDSGCKLSEHPGFKGIFDMGRGYPCNGCAFSKVCSFLKKIEQEKRIKNFGKVSFKTNKEIAEEKGISKRQASKLRRKERKEG